MNIKKTNQFQEVPFLTSKTGVSCRYNRCFQRKEQSLFPIKSTKLSLFQLLSILKDSVCCYADCVNPCPWFSISLKTVKRNFLYEMSVLNKISITFTRQFLSRTRYIYV